MIEPVKQDPMLGKIHNIQNYLRMIQRITNGDPESLYDQVTQDVFVLNVQRAAQSAIDLANLIIAEKGLGLPRSYRHGFEILCGAGIIDAAAFQQMSKMAGFRNLAVHDYAALDVNILKSILVKNLKDFETYYKQIFANLKLGPQDPKNT